jgi:hypothetical protein
MRGLNPHGRSVNPYTLAGSVIVTISTNCNGVNNNRGGGTAKNTAAWQEFRQKVLDQLDIASVAKDELQIIFSSDRPNPSGLLCD